MFNFFKKDENDKKIHIQENPYDEIYTTPPLEDGELKLCRNCIHFYVRERVINSSGSENISFCGKALNVSLVTGENKTFYSCNDARSDENLCGKDGKFYEHASFYKVKKDSKSSYRETETKYRRIKV